MSLNDKSWKFACAKILEKYAWRPNFSHLGWRINGDIERSTWVAKDPLDLQSTVYKTVCPLLAAWQCAWKKNFLEMLYLQSQFVCCPVRTPNIFLISILQTLTRISVNLNWGENWIAAALSHQWEKTSIFMKKFCSKIVPKISYFLPCFVL